VVGQADLSRAGQLPAADQPGVADGAVWGPKGTVASRGRSPGVLAQPASSAGGPSHMRPRAVLDGLCQVGGLDGLSTCQVGDGPAQLQNPVESPGAHL
jgi:hypothetical protein